MTALYAPPFHGRSWRPSPHRLREVADRDDWTCWLCLQPVEPGLPPEDRQRASVDHVIRRRDGGSHRLRNLRLAHACCNEARG